MSVSCFYHRACNDGHAALFAVQRKHTEVKAYDVDYYESAPCYPEGIVYVVDFTFTDPNELRRLVDRAEHVYHFDHHAGAQETIAKLKAELDPAKYTVVFDLERSGAGITWDELHGPDTRPAIINYVEDRDLWRFRYSQSRAIFESLQYRGRSYSTFATSLAPDVLVEMIREGKALMEKRRQRCLRCIDEHTYDLTLEDDAGSVTIPVVWIENKSDASEATELLLQHTGRDFVAAYNVTDDMVAFRLTSSPVGPDVIPYAKRFNGGGHTHAGGFKVPHSHPLVAHLPLSLTQDV